MTPTQQQAIRRLHLRVSAMRRQEILNIDAGDLVELLEAAAAFEDRRAVFLRIDAGQVLDLLNRIWAGEAAAARVGRFTQHMQEQDRAELAGNG